MLSPLWADEGDAAASASLLDDLLLLLDNDPEIMSATPPPEEEAATSGTDASDAPPSPPPPPSPPSLIIAPRPLTTKNTHKKRPASKASCPIKRALDGLRDEAEQLTKQLLALRSRPHGGDTELALTERFKRRRAEHERQLLRDSINAQTQFLRGLRVIVSPPAVALNLCQLLHNYTRLPRDRSMRWSEYAALGEERRLRSAVDLLCRETEALTCEDSINTLAASVASPFIKTEVATDSQGFGVTTTSVYAVETGDVGAVLRGACVAVRDIVAKCQSYQCTNLKRVIVDPDASAASANFLYRIMGVHHKSLRDSDELSVESHIVTLYKQMDDYAIVLWDFVDDDELHPTMSSTDITRQAVGACLIRREMCEDGVERSVYRSLSTRWYYFHRHDGRGATLQRFQDLAIATVHDNELIFRDILLDAIAKEEAAYARVVRAVR